MLCYFESGGGKGGGTWNLVQVYADPVILRIAVEEHPELEEGVWAVFDPGDHAAW